MFVGQHLSSSSIATFMISLAKIHTCSGPWAIYSELWQVAAKRESTEACWMATVVVEVVFTAFYVWEKTYRVISFVLIVGCEDSVSLLCTAAIL